VLERGGEEDLEVAAEALRQTRSWTVAEKVASNRRAVTSRGEQQAE
jgi:hypothetical protein